MTVLEEVPFPDNELIVKQGKYIRQKFSDNSLDLLELKRLTDNTQGILDKVFMTK